jgi:hypothetical protein
VYESYAFSRPVGFVCKVKFCDVGVALLFKGMLSGVSKPNSLLSRSASAMEAKFQVIFFGIHLGCCQDLTCRGNLIALFRFTETPKGSTQE